MNRMSSIETYIAWHFCFRHLFIKKNVPNLCSEQAFVATFWNPLPSLLLCGPPIIKLLILNYFGILLAKLCLLNVRAVRERREAQKVVPNT